MRLVTLHPGQLIDLAINLSDDVFFLKLKRSRVRGKVLKTKGVLDYLKSFMIAFSRSTDQDLSELVEFNVRRRQIRVGWLFNRPIVAYIYRKHKYIQSNLLLTYFTIELEKIKPDAVLLWNGSLMPGSILKLAAKNLAVPITYFENGFFPGTVQVDNFGLNGANSVPRNASFYRDLPIYRSEELPQSLNVRQQKNNQKDQDEIPEMPFVFVPMQVPSDMQILELSPWIKSMEQYYFAIFEIANSFPDLRFVVKEHPSFKLSIQKHVPFHENIRFANAALTADLIKDAVAVITINSTVGMEALSLGKKVISLGTAYYNINGLVQHAPNLVALNMAVKSLEQFTIDAALFNQFVGYIYNEFLVRGDLANCSNDFVNDVRNRILANDLHSKALKNIITD